MGKAQGRTLREVDEQVFAAKRLYSWDFRMESKPEEITDTTKPKQCKCPRLSVIQLLPIFRLGSDFLKAPLLDNS